MPYRTSKHVQREALRPKLKPSLLARPVKETKKPPTTISTSAILKRKPMKEVYGKKHSRRHRIRGGSQHELFLDYQDQVENSRNELLNSSHAAIRNTHADLTASLAKLEMHDTDFYNNVEAQRQVLLAPIAEETVETDFTRNGKSVKEVAQIGQRIEAFKSMLVTKEAELELYWAEWEKVQAKIVQLGIEVLGAEAFEGGSAGDPRERKGYRREMEDLDLEHQIWLEEMREEIQLMSEESIKKMETTEKELDATLRKEQASLIAKVFANSD